MGERLAAAQRQGPPPKAIPSAPDGEATLERGLVAANVGLQRFGLPLAVLTNASLMDDRQVTGALLAADIVSLKVDAVDEGIWRAVSRPHGSHSLSRLLQAAHAPTRTFTGRLRTETLLVKSLNDRAVHLHALAGFLSGSSCVAGIAPCLPRMARGGSPRLFPLTLTSRDGLCCAPWTPQGIGSRSSSWPTWRA